MARNGDRILFVSDAFCYPPVDGGKVRTYQILRHLAARRPVAMLAPAPPRPEDCRGIEALGVELETVPRRRPPLAGPLYAARALFTRRPYPLDKNFSRALLRRLRERIASGAAGTLYLSQLDAAQYADFLGPLRRRVRAVADTQNVLTTLYARLAEAEARPWARAYVDLQRRRMERYERGLFARLDRCLVCSREEADLLAGWGIDHVTVIPNGVDTSYFRPTGVVAAANGHLRLLFTGAMDYPPNDDAARWFAEAVLPGLAERCPGAVLTVAGKNPSEGLRRLGRPGRVELTGFVDDIRPWFERAQVFVVPLRIGGGTRLKILEAMAMGLPVVSTRVGAEGIEAREGEEILLADGPREMAEAIAALAADPARRAELGRRGRALVERRYDWSRVLAALPV